MLTAIADDAMAKDSLSDTHLAVACLLAFLDTVVSNISIKFDIGHITIKLSSDQLHQDDEVVIEF